MSGNRIAERKAAKLPCEWLVAKSGCSGALSFKRRWNTGHLQAEVRPSLPISLGKGPRPVKGLLVKRLRIGVGMALPVPGFKVRILRDPADTPQVEFRGPLFQLGHRHALKRRFRRVSGSTSTQSPVTPENRRFGQRVPPLERSTREPDYLSHRSARSVPHGIHHR